MWCKAKSRSESRRETETERNSDLSVSQWHTSANLHPRLVCFTRIHHFCHGAAVKPFYGMYIYLTGLSYLPLKRNLSTDTPFSPSSLSHLHKITRVSRFLTSEDRFHMVSNLLQYNVHSFTQSVHLDWIRFVCPSDPTRISSTSTFSNKYTYIYCMCIFIYRCLLCFYRCCGSVGLEGPFLVL